MLFTKISVILILLGILDMCKLKRSTATSGKNNSEVKLLPRNY